MEEVTEIKEISVYLGTGRSPEGLGLGMTTQSQWGPPYCKRMQWAFMTVQDKLLEICLLVLTARQKYNPVKLDL